MPRRTKQEAEETRDRILDSAERLFQQRGVSRTSLHELAQAAGVTRGAIYWHFRDKADVFNAMMDRVCMPLEADDCDPHLAPDDDDDPLGSIRDGLIELLRRTADDERIRRVFEIATHKVEYVDELLAVRDRHLQVRDACLRRTERALRAAIRLGQLTPRASTRSLAIGLHALVDGLIQNWMLEPSSFALVRVGRDAVNAYLAGVRAPAVVQSD